MAVSETCTIGRILRFSERGKYLEIAVFDAAGEFLCELDEEEFFEIFGRADLHSPVSAYLSGAGVPRGNGEKGSAAENTSETAAYGSEEDATGAEQRV